MSTKSDNQTPPAKPYRHDDLLTFAKGHDAFLRAPHSPAGKEHYERLKLTTPEAIAAMEDARKS